MKIKNVIDLKNKNLKNVIDYMRFKEYSIKKQMAVDLNLSFATVSNMTNFLMQTELIGEVETYAAPSVGRSPKSFIFNAQRYTILVLDLHKMNRIVLYEISLGREILHRKEYPNNEIEDTGRYLENLAADYNDFLVTKNIHAADVIGVGTVISGVYDSEKEIVAGTINRVFDGQPMRRLLRELTGKPVIIENDANLAAIYASCVTGTKDLVYIYLDNGIGIGVVTCGYILRSVSGYSSEIAHAPIGYGGRRCPYCGNRDCLQTDLSREGYLSKYNYKDAGIEKTSDAVWLDFADRVEKGDTRAIEVVDENTAILSRALSTVTSLMRPKTIVVGGLPRALSERTLPACEKGINSRKYYMPHINIMNDDKVQQTIARGAAEVVYSAWYPNSD